MTIPTSPFPYNFKVWDVLHCRYVFVTQNKSEVYEVFVTDYNNWVVREETIWRSRRYYYDSALPKTRFVNDYRAYQIHDHFGSDITQNILDEYHNPRRYKSWHDTCHDSTEPDIRYKKGNPNKIKRGYGTYNYWDSHEGEFPYKTYCYHRILRTMPERRRNAADCDDYGHEIVRGKRRGRNLPDPWDDHENSATHEQKCWKRHSKRRHQWKPKTDKYS